MNVELTFRTNLETDIVTVYTDTIEQAILYYRKLVKKNPKATFWGAAYRFKDQGEWTEHFRL